MSIRYKQRRRARYQKRRVKVRLQIVAEPFLRQLRSFADQLRDIHETLNKCKAAMGIPTDDEIREKLKI